MKKITRADIRDILAYEKIRPQERARIIALKKNRRIEAGEHISIVFENRETVIFQIEEMVRAERIVKEEAIEDEIRAYNSLIPDANELSATLLIEITDQRRIKAALEKLLGLDTGRKVWLEFGGAKVHAIFEGGRSEKGKISAVHFLRFPFTTQQSRRFRTGEDTAWLVVNHPNYRQRVKISPEMRASLTEDLS
jgi:hypothetical protein